MTEAIAVTDTLQNIASAAAELFLARQERKPVEPIRTRWAIASADDAYKIQKTNTERWRAAGRRSIGRKIGLTSVAVQRQLGVDQPDFGVLWADLCYSSGDCVPASAFMQPKVEAELAFLLGRDLVHASVAMHEVVAAVDCVLPAMEIVDSAISNWDIRLVDTIADNASSGGLVLGVSPRALSQIDLRCCGMLMTRKGDLVSHGVGAACLGNPLNALHWLARTAVALGDPLRAGDLVLSGALGPMVSAQPGDAFNVEIQGFDPFTMEFSQ